MPITGLAALEICSGAGGQAAGLEAAGFDLAAAIEIDPHACRTLRTNRPNWRVVESDVREIDGRQFRGVDLFAAGVPCPPFSIAGKQLGQRDDRDLFPEALRLIEETNPTTVLLENVPGFAMSRFNRYRKGLLEKLEELGYWAEWRVVHSVYRNFGPASFWLRSGANMQVHSVGQNKSRLRLLLGRPSET